MNKLSILLILSLFFLSHCATKNIIKSYKQTGNTDASQISGIDNKSKIQWRIANDNKKLYFRFESSDKSIQRMLLFNGFTLIIDTTGHSKENLSLRVNNRIETENQSIPRSNPDPKNFKPGSIQSFKEGFWKEDDNETLIDFQFEKTDFSATYKIDSFELILCNVTIPLTAIKTNGINALNKMSIGLKIEHGQKPQHRTGESFGDDQNEGIAGEIGGSGGRMSGGMGENRGGRMGQGAMESGRHGSGRMGESSIRSGASSVEFWFSTELAK